MHLCPQCRRTLAVVHDEHGRGRACSQCGGRALPFGDLRTALPAAVAVSLEHAVRTASPPGHRPCPGCSAPMVEVEAGGEGPPTVVGGCARCRLSWFDADLVPRLRPEYRPRRRRGPAGPADVAEVLGRYELRRGEDAVAEPGIEFASGEGLAAWTGLPTLHDRHREAARPWVTYGLAAACALTWVVTVVAGVATRGLLHVGELQDAVIESAGFIPADPLRHGGATWITSVFVHAGVWHLLANLWVLALFGERVESRIGSIRTLALFLGSGLAGALLDLATAGGSGVPRVGASGGISGLLGFSAFALSATDVGFYVPNWRSGTRYTFTRVRVPLPWVFALWIGLQVLGMTHRHGRIAFACHVGGALAGIGAWILATRRRAHGNLPPPVLPPPPEERRPFPSAVPVTPAAPALVDAPPTPAEAPSSPSGFTLEPERPPPQPSRPATDGAPAAPATTTNTEPAAADRPEPYAAPRMSEWTVGEGVRDTLQALRRRAPRAAAIWAALASVLFAFGTTVPPEAVSVPSLLLVAFLSLAAGSAVGEALGRDLVQEVGFTGWIPAGLAAGAGILVTGIVGLVLGFLFPLDLPILRALVPWMGAGGAAAWAVRRTWAEN